MNTKTALITGGTSGIGLSIVEHLVKKQYQVYYIGTNAVIGKEIERRLLLHTDKKVVFVQLDLSDLNEVYIFSKEFIKNHKRLDLLANIAGVLQPKRIETNEGVELNFAVSYLSAYILSTELFPILKESPNSRVINVGAKPNIVLKELLDFADLNLKHHYNPFQASSKAVHAKTVLTKILSEKYAGHNITVNSFDPGMVQSKLMRKMPTIVRLITKMVFAFASKKSEAGILVSSNEDRNATGKLFSGKEYQEITFPEDYRKKLLDATENILSTFRKP